MRKYKKNIIISLCFLILIPGRVEEALLATSICDAGCL